MLKKNKKFKTDLITSFILLLFGSELPRTKTLKVGSLKNGNFNLLSFKRCPYDNDYWPISLEDLNIILGARNGFSGKCHKSCDRLFFLN